MYRTENFTSTLSYLKNHSNMSKLMENDGSDDDMLYSVNSDISNIDSDEVKNDTVNDASDSPCESSDDECVSTNNKHHEDWSGESLKSNLPSYNSKLQLLPGFQSNLLQNATPMDIGGGTILI
ncbi:unnamed protein product [Rotaria magnacalcarata]|uniref:Uncharacterized protein n=2 Tax=Rotaria magnacalcarata TaxID=392030 RepID=A0A819ZYJ1_9BILA|nr:unnamed protein product [Rotaria magnacalcarata]